MKFIPHPLSELFHHNPEKSELPYASLASIDPSDWAKAGQATMGMTAEKNNAAIFIFITRSPSRFDYGDPDLRLASHPSE
jgi:hypothetical protein